MGRPPTRLSEGPAPPAEAWSDAPGEQVDTDLAVARAWAGRLARGKAESALRLRAVDSLPASAGGPVARLSDRLDALSAARLATSKAPTMAEFDERWASTVEEDGFTEEREARVVLGLPVEDQEEHEGEAEGLG